MVNFAVLDVQLTVFINIVFYIYQ